MRTCTIVGGFTQYWVPSAQWPQLKCQHALEADLHAHACTCKSYASCVVLAKNRQSRKIPNKAETDRKEAEECQVNAMKRNLLHFPLWGDRATTLPFGCQQFGTTVNRFHWLLLLLPSCCRVFKLLLQPEKVVQSKQENNRDSQQVFVWKSVIILIYAPIYLQYLKIYVCTYRIKVPPYVTFCCVSASWPRRFINWWPISIRRCCDTIFIRKHCKVKKKERIIR